MKRKIEALLREEPLKNNGAGKKSGPSKEKAKTHTRNMVTPLLEFPSVSQETFRKAYEKEEDLGETSALPESTTYSTNGENALRTVTVTTKAGSLDMSLVYQIAERVSGLNSIEFDISLVDKNPLSERKDIEELSTPCYTVQYDGDKWSFTYDATGKASPEEASALGRKGNELYQELREQFPEEFATREAEIKKEALKDK